MLNCTKEAEVAKIKRDTWDSFINAWESDWGHLVRGGRHVVKNCSSEMDPPPPQFTHQENSVDGPSFAGL